MHAEEAERVAHMIRFIKARIRAAVELPPDTGYAAISERANALACTLDVSEMEIARCLGKMPFDVFEDMKTNQEFWRLRPDIGSTLEGLRIN